MDLPNFFFFFGKVDLFFSDLTAGPTYQPPVRYSDPGTPLPLTLTAAYVRPRNKSLVVP